jgi:polysaccharide export outer membrane protein
MRASIDTGSLFAILAILAGCTTLPDSGPDSKTIQKQAAQKVSYKEARLGIDYVLIEINAKALSALPVSSYGSFRGGFEGSRSHRPEVTLGVGDVIQVTIFESKSGGLFVPEEAGSRPGNFVTLPQETIDQSGQITVPYAGKIKAAGRTTRQVQSDIERSLKDRAIEPQAIVSVVTPRANQVSVLGDVKSPARLDVNPAGERVLDLISRSGGLLTPAKETDVTLQRSGRQSTMLFEALVENPSENVYVKPGDTIYVNRERRTYVAFGALGVVGLNGRIDFEETDLTLAEAIGKAGGLLDERADAAQVFLYRLVEPKTARRLGASLNQASARVIPVVFHANLKDPAAFFAVQKFEMQDKDIIYVANSDSIQLAKFLGLVNLVTSTGRGVKSDASDIVK